VNVRNLTSFQHEVLTKFLLHHLEMNTRQILMREYPAIYSNLFGVPLKVYHVNNSNMVIGDYPDCRYLGAN